MLSEEFREVITCRKNKSEKVRGIPTLLQGDKIIVNCVNVGI